MKNLAKKVFAMGWLILALCACQTDSVNPDPIADPDVRTGELFYKSFAINMEVKGPDCDVDPAGVDIDRDDPLEENYLPCMGPVDVIGFGDGMSVNDPFDIKSAFTFDPFSCECGGEISIEYEEYDYTYVFAIEGIGHMEGTIMTSDGIKFPVYLTSATGPVGEGEFEGYMYIEEPSLLVKGQDDMVETRAYITGVFVLP